MKNLVKTEVCRAFASSGFNVDRLVSTISFRLLEPLVFRLNGKPSPVMRSTVLLMPLRLMLEFLQHCLSHRDSSERCGCPSVTFVLFFNYFFRSFFTRRALCGPLCFPNQSNFLSHFISFNLKMPFYNLLFYVCWRGHVAMFTNICHPSLDSSSDPEGGTSILLSTSGQWTSVVGVSPNLDIELPSGTNCWCSLVPFLSLHL